jgi:hypothetical protein
MHEWALLALSHYGCSSVPACRHVIGPIFVDYGVLTGSGRSWVCLQPEPLHLCVAPVCRWSRQPLAVCQISKRHLCTAALVDRGQSSKIRKRPGGCNRGFFRGCRLSLGKRHSHCIACPRPQTTVCSVVCRWRRLTNSSMLRCIGRCQGGVHWSSAGFWSRQLRQLEW